jgi:hypothetical protein
MSLQDAENFDMGVATFMSQEMEGFERGMITFINYERFQIECLGCGKWLETDVTGHVSCCSVVISVSLPWRKNKVKHDY